MRHINVIAIDIAKDVYQVCGGWRGGKIKFNKRLNRRQLVELMRSQNPPCTIFLETCWMSHYWARQFMAWGHTVKLIAPQFVKPFRKGNKNDRNDVIAIYEAGQRPEMRFVSVKTMEQQEIQCLHRARQLIQKQVRALANQIRGFLSEYGMTLPVGDRYLHERLLGILEDAENELTNEVRQVLSELYEQFCIQERFVKRYDNKIKQITQSDETCRRLMKLPGVGPLIASTLVSSVGDGSQFKNGREMSAWLGLTPRHAASGGKLVLKGIGKRKDCYLRTLVIHGARSVLKHCGKKTDTRSCWIYDKQQRMGTPKAAVALANKMVREMWAILRKGEAFKFA